MTVIKKTLQENYIFFIRELARIDAEIKELPRGSISAKKIGGSTYYYHQWREGKKVKSVSLGKDFRPDLTEEINRRKTLEGQKKEVLENISVIVKAIDVQLATVEEILRTFSRYGIKATLIGSYCLPLFKEKWGMSLPTIKTQDVDLLIPLPYKGKDVDVEPLLGSLGFAIGSHPDGSTYFTNGVFKVEFLTPEKGKGIEKAVYIKELKVSATPLRYLQMLCDQPVSIRIDDYTLSIPEPWVFAYHKILISKARKAASKREKDLLQAVAILREIKKRPKELKKACSYLKTLPAPWVRQIKKQLEDKLPGFVE